ncbi:hypothetical protein KFL_001810090 [Klebsormidium nitens]|uniref:Uncharacterized protein n=1 Tax=Klebsormidium nitens TaxID=105231 RepID=A0A1Y1I7Z6_KLENI|nr:hypothetical protein KFL_001810090 [Klebsormidium nitens]|eukprot:GAQ84228.1 hypothetical protein KFL_001810090 [Klebsormidium nitens]
MKDLFESLIDPCCCRFRTLLSAPLFGVHRYSGSFSPQGPAIWTLFLRWSAWAAPLSCSALEGFVKGAGGLHTLSLAGCSRLLTRDLRFQKATAFLRALDLGNCTALDKSLFDFLPPSLQRLLLRNCWRLFQGSLQTLIRNCPLLEELDLSFDGLIAAGLGPFAAVALADLKHLRVLDLSDQGNVGSVALDKLRRANPSLQLVNRAPTSMLVKSHQSRDESVVEAGSPGIKKSEQLTTVQ